MCHSPGCCLQPELERYHGLMQVFLDPYINGLHVALLRCHRNIHVSARLPG
jgi:membrane glycosyltransferase